MTALTLGQRKDNLPAEVTRFVGRRRELPVLATAIEHHRLVTLRGAGGVGKTRLALRAAHDARDRFADGCWLVGLSALRTPELLARTVSDALGLPDEAPGGTLDDERDAALGDGLDGALHDELDGALGVLAHSLAERELLLILDACEHLAQACAGLVRVLLEAAPRLRVLVTSREPLGVPGEHALLITPLEVPADDTQAAYSDAVTLLTERARAAVPDLELPPRHAAPVTELCRRLDGIPLALELAAVRLRGMPVEEMLARLSDRLRIVGSRIAGTGRTAAEHQRTLRAFIAWSYELCTPAEQRLWAELSVFPGTFGADAVEYVCGPGSSQTLTGLAEKSLVLSAPDTSRYYLHDVVREFGAELLTTGLLTGGRPGVGPEGVSERLRGRHRDYYLRLADQARGAMLSAAQPGWLARLAEETANIRVALGHSFAASGQETAGLAMTTLLRAYWLLTGQFSEGRRWHRLAAEIDGGSPANAWAVYGAGVFAARQGDLAAARPLFDTAAGLAAALGDKDLAAHVIQGRGMVAFFAQEPRAAMAYSEMALAAYQRLGFSDPAALACYTGLASVCLAAGELSRAVRLCDECLRRCDELGEQWARGTALWVRGAARWRSGDFSAGIEDARASLRIKGPAGDLHAIAMSFDLLAACHAAQPEHTGEPEGAAVLYGAGEALWTQLNVPVLIGPACAPVRADAADTARGWLGSPRFEELAGLGATLPLSAAIAIALNEAPAVPDASAPAANGAAAARLTRREKEIAGLVAAGLANREIAARLYLSKRTVDSHLEHIFAKLGFTARTQLITWVRARGVLAAPHERGAWLVGVLQLVARAAGRDHLHLDRAGARGDIGGDLGRGHDLDLRGLLAAEVHRGDAVEVGTVDGHLGALPAPRRRHLGDLRRAGEDERREDLAAIAARQVVRGDQLDLVRAGLLPGDGHLAGGVRRAARPDLGDRLGVALGVDLGDDRVGHGEQPGAVHGDGDLLARLASARRDARRADLDEALLRVPVAHDGRHARVGHREALLAGQQRRAEPRGQVIALGRRIQAGRGAGRRVGGVTRLDVGEDALVAQVDEVTVDRRLGVEALRQHADLAAVPAVRRAEG